MSWPFLMAVLRGVATIVERRLSELREVFDQLPSSTSLASVDTFRPSLPRDCSLFSGTWHGCLTSSFPVHSDPNSRHEDLLELCGPLLGATETTFHNF
jgi:hypothetical protein